MLHPAITETIAADHQSSLRAAADRARRLHPARLDAATRSAHGPRAWAAWWFAGRTAAGRPAQPAAPDAVYASLR